MPFMGVGLISVLLATTFHSIGHNNGSKKILIAAGLYVVGGLTVGGGLFTFSSVVSDIHILRPRHTSVMHEILYSDFDSDHYEYHYGWCFFTAITAFMLAETAAVISMISYHRRFPTTEDMVRNVVPGIDRKIREREFAASNLLAHELHQISCEIRRQNIQQNVCSGSRDYFGSRMATSGAGVVEGAEGPSLSSNWGPELDNSNTLNTFQGEVQVNLCSNYDTEDYLPGSNFDAIPGTSSQNIGMTYLTDFTGDLAGVTIPIWLPKQLQRTPVKALKEGTEMIDEECQTLYPFSQHLSQFEPSTSKITFRQKLLADMGNISLSSGSTDLGSTDHRYAASRVSTIQPQGKKRVRFNTFGKSTNEISNEMLGDSEV